MLKQILIKIDRSFDAGNRENFILNEILMVISIFLFFLAILEIMNGNQMIIISNETHHGIRVIEVTFGIFFLIEFFFRVIYVYIPDKKFLTLYPWITLLVIITLLIPSFLNLAFLRIIWILKVFKIYHLRLEDKKLIATNPNITNTKIT